MNSMFRTGLSSVLLLTALAVGSEAQRAQSAAGPRVIFVCEHGAAKSVIAAAYFNKMAAERGLPDRATYRGASPQAELSVSALKGLKEDGLTLPSAKPAPISSADVTAATHIFAIGCSLPAHAASSGKADSWDDVPEDQGYAAQRDAIKKHVERLIDSSFATFALVVAATIDTVDFDQAAVGQPPAGWTATRTGSGDAKWTIEKDDTAPSKPNVLKQSGTATYPVCFKNDTSLQDGFVEVKFKAIAGKEDQAGGVAWRIKDANNYYVARANALEDNVTIYHIVNGRRTEKKRANMKVAPNVWHTLRADFQGRHFTVTYDGKTALEWDDDTFKDAGKVGVWTKADSVTLFDDFSYGAK